MKFIYQLNQILGYLEMGILAFLTTKMFIVVFLQVVFRYILNQPSPWTEELARYIFIWISMIGAAFGVMKHSHFGFELLVKKLPYKLQRFEYLFIYACMGILIITLIYHGIKMVHIVSFQITPALQIPMRYVYFSLPISGILMGFHLLCNFLTHLKEFNKNFIVMEGK